MLLTLRIKNLALVSDLTIDLQPGFNALTGETGAGKSILIGALNLLLGERADRTLLRAESDQCLVEGVFDLRQVRGRIASFLDEYGIENQDEQLFLKRSFSVNGGNRQFINGSPVPLSALETVGQWLVDIHGPHDHQSLFHTARQLELVDAHGGLSALREKFSDLAARRTRLLDEKAALVVDDETYQRQLELLRHQVSEINAARLRPDEEAELELEHRRASNAASLLQAGQNALEQLGESDQSVWSGAGALGKSLQELERLDPEASCLGSLHRQAMESWRDLQTDLSHYLEKIELDPARLQQLEERVNLLQTLKRKYGRTLPEIIQAGHDASDRLRGMEGRAETLEKLKTDLAALEVELQNLGKLLSKKRKEAGPALARAVEGELRHLGFQQSRFEIVFQPVPADSGAPGTRSGFDQVEFLFGPNPGEPARPLRAIASSGEIARVMLAVKTVLSEQDQVPVLVFDEVDANIGGETGAVVGAKMARIGGRQQVLCITHLASVAALALTHFKVTKAVEAGRTITRIEALSGENRLQELARMLGGQSQAARKHAEELLAKAGRKAN